MCEASAKPQVVSENLFFALLFAYTYIYVCVLMTASIEICSTYVCFYVSVYSIYSMRICKAYLYLLFIFLCVGAFSLERLVFLVFFGQKQACHSF